MCDRGRCELVPDPPYDPPRALGIDHRKCFFRSSATCPPRTGQVKKCPYSTFQGGQGRGERAQLPWKIVDFGPFRGCPGVRVARWPLCHWRRADRPTSPEPPKPRLLGYGPKGSCIGLPGSWSRSREGTVKPSNHVTVAGRLEGTMAPSGATADNDCATASANRAKSRSQRTWF